MGELYYIQNKGFVGNCLLWWRVGGSGYTCNLDEAWKVTKEKADRWTMHQEGCRFEMEGGDSPCTCGLHEWERKAVAP